MWAESSGGRTTVGNAALDRGGAGKSQPLARAPAAGL